MAEFFDLTLRLFLRHVVGVSSDLHADGVASACGVGGVFGPVLAYFAPVETQGRGGLHPHMHVWILHPFQASMLAKLRAGEEIPDLARRVDEWNAAVLEHVPTVQFDSVEEVGRQVGVLDVAPLPYSNAQSEPQFPPPCEETIDRTKSDTGRCSGRDPYNTLISDQLRVPATLAPGKYVLGIRWDCEKSAQVWTNCADIQVV